VAETFKTVMGARPGKENLDANLAVTEQVVKMLEAAPSGTRNAVAKMVTEFENKAPSSGMRELQGRIAGMYNLSTQVMGDDASAADGYEKFSEMATTDLPADKAASIAKALTVGMSAAASGGQGGGELKGIMDKLIPA